MSIIAGYNDSDWTEGWSAMLDGFSLFINSRMEETLSKVRFWHRETFTKNSLKLFQPISLIPDPKTLMRIEVRQSNRKLLNEPFTQCEEVEKGSDRKYDFDKRFKNDVNLRRKWCGDVVVIYLKAVLNHYAVYELQSCRSECLINYLENECLCKPAVFLATIQFNYANYEFSDMHQIFEPQNDLYFQGACLLCCTIDLLFQLFQVRKRF